MFSTLLGPLPADVERPATLSESAVTLGELGLDLVTDGADPVAPGVEPGDAAARWATVAGASAIPVKAVLLGPYSAARRDGTTPAATAEAQRPTVLALAAAGCTFVEIAEPGALPIACDPGERADFVDAHRRLVDGTEGIHASLVLTGGNLDTAGPATFFDLAYGSYAFDLIAGPDNWRLIAVAPPDRGIVCGALDPRPGGDESPELLVWAAHYAASTSGRGLARVGLANASSLAGLSRVEALRKLRIVADASRIAAVESPDQLAGHLDPRAVDARSAALGRFDPSHRRPNP
ncbi:MAG TPA: hypothetical protein VM427_00910 [Patescibacteria group bacterium]|nr:hypothetical protein [Patescibacteria group bacterium]